jgi:hypothetical protein
VCQVGYLLELVMSCFGGIYIPPPSSGLNSGNFIALFLWNLLQCYNPEDQSMNLTTSLQIFKVFYGYRLKVSVINHTRSSGVLLLRYVLLLGTFTVPRNFPVLEKLWIHESQASTYVYIFKKSRIWLFLPISCTCIFLFSQCDVLCRRRYFRKCIIN